MFFNVKDVILKLTNKHLFYISKKKKKYFDDLKI